MVEATLTWESSNGYSVGSTLTWESSNGYSGLDGESIVGPTLAGESINGYDGNSPTLAGERINGYDGSSTPGGGLDREPLAIEVEKHQIIVKNENQAGEV